MYVFLCKLFFLLILLHISIHVFAEDISVKNGRSLLQRYMKYRQQQRRKYLFFFFLSLYPVYSVFFCFERHTLCNYIIKKGIYYLCTYNESKKYTLLYTTFIWQELLLVCTKHRAYIRSDEKAKHSSRERKRAQGKWKRESEGKLPFVTAHSCVFFLLQQPRRLPPPPPKM